MSPTIVTSRSGCTASKIAAPVSVWMIWIANASPTTQTIARSGRRSALNRLWSHSVGVFTSTRSTRSKTPLSRNAARRVTNTTTKTSMIHGFKPQRAQVPGEGSR